MRKLPVFGIVLLTMLQVQDGFAQVIGNPYQKATYPEQSIYFEVAGNGIVYSGNYDLTFHRRYGLRLGVMPYPIMPDKDLVYEGDPSVILIVMGHRLWGGKNHKLETAAGFITGDINEPDWYLPRPPGLSFTVGYRYIPDKEGNLTFRAGFTPLISHGEFHPRIGISLGWVFSAPENE